MQAALIYAPGVGLAVVGGALVFASIGLEAALRGWTMGWLWLLFPPALGLLAWVRVPHLAQRHYVRASLILAEVDGQWASRETLEESLHVYLERLGRGRPDLLRALRQGWRSLRLFGTMSWVVGIVAAIVVWSDEGLDRWLWLGSGAVLLVSAVAARLADGDPPWLDLALGVDVRSVAMARLAVAWLYAQGVILPLAVPALVHHGVDALPGLLGMQVVTLIGAGIASICGVWWREGAMWAYGGTGMILWAAFVRLSA